MAMATSMLLRAGPGPVMQMPVSRAQGSEMHTMLQYPSIGGARSIAAGRSGHAVCSRERVLLKLRAQSGTQDVTKEASSDTSKLEAGKKNNNVVFVAGATGKVGSRTVRELLKSGVQVRAGVRDVSRGQAVLKTTDKSESLEFVRCDLENDAIDSCLGDAGVVVCTIGASEKELSDVTGPYRIDYKATENLIKAATRAKVNHFILVSSLGTTKFGWPASVLNLFWGVLIWKAKAEKALEESGLCYTIVRPGGMERPTDAYKETHNLILAPKDTYSGGQVSSLQIAELIAACVSNLDLARNKVLETIAETTAPLRPIKDLLAEVPSRK